MKYDFLDVETLQKVLEALKRLYYSISDQMAVAETTSINNLQPIFENIIISAIVFKKSSDFSLLKNYAQRKAENDFLFLFDKEFFSMLASKDISYLDLQLLDETTRKALTGIDNELKLLESLLG